jgi:hypothetical protein
MAVGIASITLYSYRSRSPKVMKIDTMNRALLDYFRCPDHFASFELGGELSEASGFFQFGRGTICYGSCSSDFPARQPTDGLYDAAQDVKFEGERLRLPFDLSQIVDNLRRERHTANFRESWKKILARRASSPNPKITQAAKR